MNNWGEFTDFGFGIALRTLSKSTIGLGIEKKVIFFWRAFDPEIDRNFAVSFD